MTTVVRKLPTFGIVLTYQPENGARTITSELHDADAPKEYTAAINGLESFILAAWSAGVDVEATEFLEAIEVAAQSITNYYT